MHAVIEKTPDTTIMEDIYSVMDYIAKKDVIDISTLQEFIIYLKEGTMFDGVERLVSLARHICKAMKDEEK